MEFRVFAHFTGDPVLIGVLNDPTTDVHTWTASQVYRKSESSISKKERKFAKTVNFGIIYGIGAAALGWRLKIPLREARQFLRQYTDTFPAVSEFIERHKSEVEANRGRDLGWEWRRYIWDQNFFGRRRFFWPSKAYVSINTLVQGSCADIIKTSLTTLLPLVQTSPLRLKGTVHDENIFQCPPDDVDELVPLICREMTNFHFDVALPVAAQVSQRSWGEKIDWVPGRWRDYRVG